MNRFLVITIAILLSLISINAQTSRGTVSGTVKDPNGAVVPGATVTLVNTSTAVERSAQTNNEGFYRFDAVDLGNYSVRIAAVSFGTVNKSGVVVNANQTSTVDADLTLGGQETTVDVVAEAGTQLQTEAPVRGGSISPQQITQLPVASRNPVGLALTLPGVSSNRTSLGIGTFSVNGARGRSNNFLIDGTENNDISVAGQGFQITNPDAVQEVSVQTSNFDAEFGRAGGAVVNVITRSGTKDFHGTLGFIYDSSADDAITSFQSRNPAVIARGRPLTSTQIVPSATFGGPLFLPRPGEGTPFFTERNRNFFFVSYQEDRTRTPGSTVSLITPTAAGRSVLQQYASNPNVASYLAATANTVATVIDRQPISLDPTGGAQTRGSVEIGTFIRTFSALNTNKQFQLRTDHTLSSNDQLSLRYIRDHTISPNGGEAIFPGYEANFESTFHSFAINESHTFSSFTTNELRLSYNRIVYGFPIDNPSGPAGTQPTIAITGLTTFGTSATFPQGRTANNYQVQDTVTHVLGNHTFRSGFEYLRQISTQIAPANIRGSLAYSAGGNYTALGNFVDNFGGASGAASRTFGSATYNPTLSRYAGFVQDRWKATEALTLTLGLRYENFGDSFNSIRTPAFTGLFNVNPVTRTGPYSEPNQVRKDNNNFAPAVGIAYSPSYSSGIRGMIFGEKKSVVRAGYQIGYDSFFNNITSNAVASSPNTIVTTNSSTTAAGIRGLSNFSSQFPTVAGTVTPLSAQTLIDPNLVNPYYQRYSLGIQRELPFKLVMDLSYVGSKGTKLYVTEDGNPSVRPELRSAVPAGYPTCTIGGTVTAAQATTQFPAGSLCPITGRLDNIQGSRQVRTNGGGSSYNSGQLSVTRRFTNSFQVTGAYTYSKLISNADEVFATGFGSTTALFSIPAILGGERNERALSIFDRTHRAVFSYVIQSPFFKEQKGFIGRALGGFQLTGVTTFESGAPFTIFAGTDMDGIGGALDRPVYNASGQRGVRAVAQVDANNNITRFINPEIVTARNSTGAPTDYATIDPNTAQYIVYPNYVPGASGSVVRTGTLGRNTQRSPGINNFDLTVLKRTRVSEKIFIETRADFFNAFNHPQFPGASSGIASTANALTQGFFLNSDTVNTTGGGRTVRYQVKLIF